MVEVTVDHLAPPTLHFLQGEGPELPAQLLGGLLLSCRVVEANGRRLLKGHLLVVVHPPAPAVPGPHLYARSLQLPLLLQRGQPARLLQLLLPRLPLRLLTPAAAMPVLIHQTQLTSPMRIICNLSPDQATRC